MITFKKGQIVIVAKNLQLAPSVIDAQYPPVTVGQELKILHIAPAREYPLFVGTLDGAYQFGVNVDEIEAKT